MEFVTTEDLARARSWIRVADSIAVLTGAGISAESGVPTFRDADGLWRNFRFEDLATPEAFERDPQLVWDWYNFRRARIAEAQPNRGHKALVALETRKSEFTLITQNVDGLHELAGSKNILKLHGDIWQVRCTKCGAEWVDRRPSLPEIPPHCLCGALARPGVVWFGEPLPKRVIDEATQAVKSSEILLVIGTSAIVYPAAGLIPIAKAQGRTVIEINPDETPCSDMADCSLHGPAGEILPLLVGSDSHRSRESGARGKAPIKTIGEMSVLEIRTTAAWLRQKLQGRASPFTLSQLSDEELVTQYLRSNEEERKHATPKKEEFLQSLCSTQFPNLSLESRLFLVVVRLIQNTPIPFDESRSIFEESLKLLGAGSTGFTSSSRVFERLLEIHKDLAHVANITARFWSRHMFQIEGGPPPIIFPSIQPRDSALIQAIDDRISTDDDWQSLAKICLLKILESKSILEVTRPNVVGVIDMYSADIKDRSKEKWHVLKCKVEYPCQRISESIDVNDPIVAPYTSPNYPATLYLMKLTDNFMFNSAVEAIERCPNLLDDAITGALVKLLRESSCEHIFYTCCKSFRPIFTSLPEELQKAILQVSHQQEAKGSVDVGIPFQFSISMNHAHVELTRTILMHHNRFGQLQTMADVAIRKIIAEGHEEPAEIIVASIRRMLKDGGSGAFLFDLTPGEILMELAKNSYHTRAVVADLWSKQKGNPYPELEDVYALVSSDQDGYVQTAFRDGLKEARAEWAD